MVRQHNTMSEAVLQVYSPVAAMVRPSARRSAGGSAKTGAPGCKPMDASRSDCMPVMAAQWSMRLEGP